MSALFANETSFNDDISHWDVSSVTDMRYMFNSTTTFDQDLSSWCVSNIDSEPTDFSTGAPLTAVHKPDWGRSK